MTKKADSTGDFPEPPPAPASQVTDHHDVLPPAYSGPASSASSYQAIHSNPISRHPRISGLPSLAFAHYAPIGSTISKDRSTVTISDPKVTSSLQSLISCISQQAALPPRSSLRMVGSHTKYAGSETVVDFDISLDMLRYFVPPSQAEKLNYIRIPSTTPNSTLGLQEVAKAFLADSVRPRHLTISRVCSNLDTEYLTGRIHTLLASLNYRGTISITVPSTHSQVVIDTESKSIATTFRNLFSAAKVYEIQAVWPYATTPPGGADTRDVPRHCVVQTEESWWNDWKAAIKHAILDKRVQHWVGVEDWMEVAMTPVLVKPDKQPQAWGMDSS